MTQPLSHISVQVATPSLDDKYSGDYLTGLMNTKTMLEHFGAQFQWVKYPKCSDLPHARNKIHGMFMRDPHKTHLMMIDADMGWEPNDIIRLANLDRDFVAGVGCKKKFPLEWCVGNFSETDGHLMPCPAHQVGEEIIAEPLSVGGAFVMINKSCAMRMHQAYPELHYRDRSDGQMECAIYDPVIIVNGEYRERFFDDFAYCHRWRKIGGKVCVLPDIHLKHDGSLTFEGRWIDSFGARTEDDEGSDRVLGMNGFVNIPRNGAEQGKPNGEAKEIAA